MEKFSLDKSKIIDGEYYWYETELGWFIGLIHIDEYDFWMELIGSDNPYETFEHVINFDYKPINKRKKERK